MTIRIHAAGDEVQPAASPKARILVVDDVPEICQFFRDVSRRIRGIDISLVTEINSMRALERARGEDFDIVVSDYRMREVDGVEVLRAAYGRNPAGSRVLMTGYNEIPTSIERIRSANIDAYVTKPLHAQEILLLLVAFLHADTATIEEQRSEARAIEMRSAKEEGATRSPADGPAPSGIPGDAAREDVDPTDRAPAVVRHGSAGA